MYPPSSSPTYLIRVAVNELFDSFDKELDTILDKQDKPALTDFMEYYMLRYPTLADAIYSYIYENEPDLELRKKYTDYTLRKVRDGVKDSQPVEDYPDVYDKILKKKYPVKKLRPDDYKALIANLLATGKITEDQAAMLQKDCAEPLRKFSESYWRTHLDENKGYHFFGRANLSYSIRNVVFHLAFALDMDAETVSAILTKCLLMQDFNPKDHREVIYRWCLKHHISYQDMIVDYMAHYHSAAFDKEYRDLKIADIHNTATYYLIDKLSAIFDEKNYPTPELQKHAFMDYLWKIKVLEKNILNREKTPMKTDLIRKTPQKVFWEHFKLFPVEVYTAPGQPKPPVHTFDGLMRQKLGLTDDEKLPEKDNSQEDDIRFRLKILEESRVNYYNSNCEPLLPVPILKELFNGIEYTYTSVLKRKKGDVPISRNLLIATMFIGYFSDYEYQIQDVHIGIDDMDRFENQISLDLRDSGLYPFYLRNPFELFLVLCFLSKDPLGYFLSSWEHALKNA